jgi:hypothetical protein
MELPDRRIKGLNGLIGVIPNDGQSLQNLPVGARHASPARAARFSNNPDSFGITHSPIIALCALRRIALGCLDL